jgi:hypothetical protein
MYHLLHSCRSCNREALEGSSQDKLPDNMVALANFSQHPNVCAITELARLIINGPLLEVASV